VSTLVLILAASMGLSRAAGLTGIGVAWLLANGVVAGFAAPHVIRIVRRGREMAKQ
jgi:hypothetical protein